MAILVVEFQAYPMPDETFILKEAAMADVVSNLQKQLIAKPPCSFNMFSTWNRRTLKYVQNKVHGIPWDAGYIEIESVEEQIKKAIQEADVVYTKGIHKVNFLLNLTGAPVNKIVNLDKFPSISKTVERNPNFQCQYNHPRHNKLRCALEQAIRYRDFLRENYYFKV